MKYNFNFLLHIVNEIFIKLFCLLKYIGLLLSFVSIFFYSVYYPYYQPHHTIPYHQHHNIMICYQITYVIKYLNLSAVHTYYLLVTTFLKI